MLWHAWITTPPHTNTHVDAQVNQVNVTKGNTANHWENQIRALVHSSCILPSHQLWLILIYSFRNNPFPQSIFYA